MTGPELRAWRTTNKLTQADLGQLLEVHYLTIGRWERGEREIPTFLHLALETLERRRTHSKTVAA